MNYVTNSALDSCKNGRCLRNSQWQELTQFPSSSIRDFFKTLCSWHRGHGNFQTMSTPGRTPLQMKESLTNVLNWLLFLKIFLLVTSISFISVALFGRQERQHIASREREFLLTSGLYVGSVSLLAGALFVWEDKIFFDTASSLSFKHT